MSADAGATQLVVTISRVAVGAPWVHAADAQWPASVCHARSGQTAVFGSGWLHARGGQGRCHCINLHVLLGFHRRVRAIELRHPVAREGWRGDVRLGTQ